MLRADDFYLNQDPNTRKLLLCNRIQNISFILFYAPSCQYCQQLVPIFKQLPMVLTGCQFGMVDISKNFNIVQMSRQTENPIQMVPCLFLYLNGFPYLAYVGEGTLASMQAFVVETAKNIQQKISFMGDKRVHVPEKGVPRFAWKNPIEGDLKVTYLEFKEAYHPAQAPAAVQSGAQVRRPPRQQAPPQAPPQAPQGYYPQQAPRQAPQGYYPQQAPRQAPQGYYPQQAPVPQYPQQGQRSQHFPQGNPMARPF